MPTATSVRAVPAKLLIDNRIVINNHLARARGGKVSFTHLIGFALVEALAEMPEMNRVVRRGSTASRPWSRPAHINLGIAIDLAKPDGTRQLLVPNIKRCETMDFAQFWAAYEDVVRRARTGKLTADDFAGTTISLTNPGTIGTVHSVPRLMKGQGAIIGVGAMEYPAEYQGASEETLARAGGQQDHHADLDLRPPDHPGRPVRRVPARSCTASCSASDGFYDRIFHALRIPYEPIRWVRDISIAHEDEINKTARVQELIHAYRVRGHLMADTDPLEYKQRRHPDLDITNHGLTLWDLDREFATGGFGGKPVMKLRDILGVLRDSYCRTIGIEYMHIQDPEQRAWIQERIEHPYAKPSPTSSCASCAGSTRPRRSRPSCRPSTSARSGSASRAASRVIPLLDAILSGAAAADLDEVCIGMAHRGRLNVLANIAGKSYGQIFREFEGTQDPRRSRAPATSSTTSAPRARSPPRAARPTKVYLAANPSPPRGRQPGARGHRPRQAGPARTGAARSSRCCRCWCTATPRSPARAWSPRRSTSRSCAATAPAARSTSSSTTRSASPPPRRRRARRSTAPTSRG